jgi:hypothetical protein
MLLQLRELERRLMEDAPCVNGESHLRSNAPAQPPPPCSTARSESIGRQPTGDSGSRATLTVVTRRRQLAAGRSARELVVHFLTAGVPTLVVLLTLSVLYTAFRG